jgi:citrate lyase subunit beta/citryl-CoA lyase
LSGLAFRSVVFVGAHDADALAAALASEADAVVADLEDGTPADAKAEARATVARVFAADRTRPARLIRLNELGSLLADADLELAATLTLDGVVVPQATAETIDGAAVAGLPVLAVIESARGLRDAYEIASRPFVQALQLGANDLARDLRLERRADGVELLHARSRLVVDAAAAGLGGIFDRVLAGVDEAELEHDARFARSLGFTGKSTTSPAHAAVINRVFGDA